MAVPTLAEIAEAKSKACTAPAPRPKRPWAKPVLKVEPMWIAETGRPDRLSAGLPVFAPPTPFDEIERWARIRKGMAEFEWRCCSDEIKLHLWDVYLGELNNLLDLCVRWKRNYLPLWERDLAKCRQMDASIVHWINSDLLPGEHEQFMKLTVRGGKLMQRPTDETSPWRETRVLDLWKHVCRVCVGAYGDKARRRAFSSYRRIMGRFPDGEFVDDGGFPDPRVVDLMSREYRWWNRRRRSR